ncbi:MAG: acetyl-CoA carboxylase biotin carboxyl carrier protein [Bacteroidales bacterium]|jgi:acetyl-CoA carboxylase biotin carboxyl carrier protein|nr:acetyl-CoA carboxylase biotin carboxyl carrier protein [Bacteroidales bacterium]MBQ5512179.1 acetyl-CoA carboxylase biotin carboxyl carrier protein [Bacteroidales bacterium]MBQ5549602.1 acetyl-CoA carboxylase biotin carboxyl carrier protein [Bacteroidales bacterium]MBQ5574552.1 acetyl-CoA carboxylase biotin carboxyl carrier protein [Bacteroidales bacterium]MBR2201367.1 acetyl-CoA carboxylase biotin carboxyl carrier protein [Bacteroidales bacterium]
MANLKEIQDFIRTVSKIGISEVDVQTDDLKLNVKFPVGAIAAPAAGNDPIQIPYHLQMASGISQQMGNPVQAATTTTTPIEFRQETKEDDKKYLTIKSPMVGTFYRRPSPDKPIYVNVGDEISKGKVLCVIEAMKLFNEIEAEVSGKIAKILVEDGSPVEYDQPLFLIEP